MELRIKHFSTALESLQYLLSADLSELQSIDERLLDGLENGKAQKFEIVTELCWKCIKDYLRDAEGLDVASPKQAIKAFYRVGKINEDNLLNLLEAIDTRNQLSHIYSEDKFKQALSRFPILVNAVQAVLDELSSET